jgi:hypothetical protein
VPDDRTTVVLALNVTAEVGSLCSSWLLWPDTVGVAGLALSEWPGRCRQPELPEVGNLSRLTVTVAVMTVTEVGSLRWQPEWAVTVTDTESSSRSPLSCGEPSSIRKAVGRGIL